MTSYLDPVDIIWIHHLIVLHASWLTVWQKTRCHDIFCHHSSALVDFNLKNSLYTKYAVHSLFIDFFLSQRQTICQTIKCDLHLHIHYLIRNLFPQTYLLTCEQFTILFATSLDFSFTHLFKAKMEMLTIQLNLIWFNCRFRFSKIVAATFDIKFIPFHSIQFETFHPLAYYSHLLLTIQK